MKRAPLAWLHLHWPREVTDAQLLALWHRLPALAGWPLIVEAVGQGGIVRHRLGVVADRQAAVTGQLRAELPGLGIDAETGRSSGPLHLAGTVRFSTRRRAVATTDPASASRTILTALALAGRGEVLLLQWVLGRPLHPAATAGTAPRHPEHWSQHVLDAVTGRRRPTEAEAHRALAAKQGEAGWRALGRLAVQAATPKREAHLLGQVAGALRSLETPGLRVVVHRQRPSAAQQAAVPSVWPLRLNTREVTSLTAWPVGKTGELPVEALSNRPLKPSAAIPRDGRVVAEATYPGAVRPLALSPAAATRHLYVLGPSGVGKSTLLLNLIAQDLEAGHGLVVIEPKGDLIADILARVPATRTDDVVLIEPGNAQQPVGLNPLAPTGRSPELAADQLLGTFHALYADYWGPRTQDILGAALLSLAQVPGMTLPAVPVLLSDANFRRRVLSQIDDPIGLGPFWAGFEAWSPGERTAAIAPVLNKLRPFLIRPSLRVILGQAEPRFDIRRVFSQRKALLVNLAKGQLGPEASALLGSLIIGQVWQAALGRSALPPERRHPVFLVIDEFQDYLHLPLDLGDALAQARGLGLGLTLANQHLSQLPTDIRSAVLVNAQSKVCFRLGSDDARVLAADSPLLPEDFASLGAYQCYVQLMAGDAVQSWASARSLPPPPAISDPAVVRAASAANYGRERTEVEAALRELVSGERPTDDGDDLAPRRRGGRS